MVGNVTEPRGMVGDVIEATRDVRPGARGGYTIRAFEPGDIESLCALFELRGWGPFRDGHSFTPDDLRRGLDEWGAVEVMVAVAERGVVGCIAVTPTSVQRGSRANSVFGEHVVVHPAYVSTGLAAHLMMTVAVDAVSRGYDRVDGHVEVGNDRAERLYRRMGFQQITGEPCEDGCVLFETHMPMIVRYLVTALRASSTLPASWLAGRRDIVKLFPRRARRSGVDVLGWHGVEVLAYELRLPGDEHVVLLVDRETDRVAAVGGRRQEVACWPEGGRSMPAGQDVTVHFRVVNRADAPARAVVRDDVGHRRVFAGTLASGEELRGRLTVPAPVPGRREVHLAVEIDEPGAPGRSRTWRTSTWFDVRAAGGPAAPAFAPRPGGWEAASGPVTFRLDGTTGELQATVGGEVAVRELWPDVGPPFPGGHKAPVARRIEDVTRPAVGGLELRSSANRWIELHESLAERADERGLRRLLVRRSFAVVADGVLRVDTAVELEGASSGGARWLRTWPRVCLRAPALSLPAPGGGPAPAGPLPYGSPNFEFLRSPVAPGPAPWTAFTAGDLTAGLVFPGAAETRFGGRWMPSVLYDVPALGERARRYELPPYLVVVSEHGPAGVAAAWAALGPTLERAVEIDAGPGGSAGQA